MNLVIRAQSLHGEPLSQVITGRFDERGGTIGRSDANTLTLPDPERHVSRLQAEIVHSDGAYTLCNVGGANPIVVNGSVLKAGDRSALRSGDELVIGGYTLRIGLETGGSGTPEPSAKLMPTVIAASDLPEPASGAPATLPPGAGGGLTDILGPAPPRGKLFSGPVSSREVDAHVHEFLRDPPTRRDAGAAGNASPQFNRLSSDVPVAPSAPNHAHRLDAPYDPPPVPRPPRGAATPDEPADALWAAFCDGAGLTGPAAARHLDAALMRQLGAMLLHAVDGSVRLAVVRTSVKQEFSVPVTMVQSRDNNPLKFAVNAQTALNQLLQPPLPGYLGGADAIRDLMDDLIGHQMGTLAGMQAALDGVLKRFEPAPLERMLVTRGVLDALVPMQRRARLWELYLQHHAAVREQVQEDYKTLFVRAFAQAYEAQIDRLSAARARD